MNRITHFLNLGYDQETIKKYRSEMDFDNIKMVKNVSLLLIGILFILLVFYVLIDNQPLRNWICMISIVMMIFIHLISSKMLKNKASCTPARCETLINVLTACCFAVGIYLGTFAAATELAVAPVWMFFFAILIFNRFPLQNIIMLTVSGIIFGLCSYLLKSSFHFQYDVMHAVTSILASLYMAWKKSQIKFENIIALSQQKKTNEEIMETVKQKEQEAIQLRIQAELDELSGFYKKESFQKMVEGILENSDCSAQHLLICSDIDNFKNINDTFGHRFGDQVLKEIVQEITSEMGKEALLGRFGGDEFLIFLPHVKDTDSLLKYLDQLDARCHKTYCERGYEEEISLSSGYALFPQDGKNYTQLFEVADAGLYKTKRKKKNIIQKTPQLQIGNCKTVKL